MTKISGFTFVHNGFEGGYPFREAVRAVLPFVDEVVAVDAASDDGTREALLKLGCRVLDAEWGDRAGETLARLHAMNAECRGDVVLHFEADEVWDWGLASEAVHRVMQGQGQDFAVLRLQVEQNFQRVRWYPWPVHRVFPRGSVRKVGETTDRAGEATLIGAAHGFVWDCTNCFRDNWVARLRNQSALRGGEPLNLLAVPGHANEPVRADDVEAFLAQPHWEWKGTPLAVPPLLRPLVGMTRYE
jgi:hypothetical protein